MDSMDGIRRAPDDISGQESTSITTTAETETTQLPAPPPPPLSGQNKQTAPSPFRCSICARTYERADHLNRHLRNHENLRPHKCTECSKSFNRADLLRRHRASHDRDRSLAVTGTNTNTNTNTTRSRDPTIPTITTTTSNTSNTADTATTAATTAAPTNTTNTTTTTTTITTTTARRRRPPGQRERVVAACLTCITAKSKCRDEKPCTRCQDRHIECLPGPSILTNVQPPPPPPPRIPGTTTATTEDEENLSGFNNSRSQTQDENQNRNQNQPRPLESHRMLQLNTPAHDVDFAIPNMEQLSSSSTLHPTQAQSNTLIPGLFNDANTVGGIHRTFDAYGDFQGLYDEPALESHHGFSFMPRDAYEGHEGAFGLWDIDLEGIELAYLDLEHTNVSQGHAHTILVDQTDTSKAISRRSAAFRRSTWIWNPTQNDQSTRGQDDHDLDEQSISSLLTPAYDSPSINGDDFVSCFMTTSRRDHILGILHSLRRDPTQMPSLPSIPLLNEIIQVYFLHANNWIDHMVHAASFDGAKALPQLLLSIIAAGATLISIPAVSKMGLALQEVIRLTVGEFWEQNSSNTRNLQSLQAFVIGLDVGLWSGFKRKMEVAESFGQPAITILRRAGVFSAPKLPQSYAPLVSDSEAVVDSKWKMWVEKESFKRLALHLFVHDVLASVGLQKPPLILFTELKFELPASKGLWLAKSGLEWRDKFLEAQDFDLDITTFLQAMHNPELLSQPSKRYDMHLSSWILLHSFWGQIHGLRDAKKYHSRASSLHQLSILATMNELYRDLLRFSARLPQLTNNSTEVLLSSELFLMIFHANFEDLQRFAGRFGEGEADVATEDLRIWAKTTEARTAVCHAANVIRAATKLPANALMSFKAISVYYAILTLWIYGLMAPQLPSWGDAGSLQSRSPAHPAAIDIVLNEDNESQLSGFRENGRGVPGIHVIGSDGAEFIPLKAADRVLHFATQLYRMNYPDRHQPLPPLVEGLCELLKELGSLPASRMSRAQSEVAS